MTIKFAAKAYFLPRTYNIQVQNVKSTLLSINLMKNIKAVGIYYSVSVLWDIFSNSLKEILLICNIPSTFHGSNISAYVTVNQFVDVSNYPAW